MHFTLATAYTAGFSALSANSAVSQALLGDQCRLKIDKP